MQMHVVARELSVARRSDAELEGMRLDPGERQLGGFADHVAETARQLETAVAGPAGER
jgi:hypothetical protein